MAKSRTKARVIYNPASGGDGFDPEEVRRKLDGYELEWIETGSAEEAENAAWEWGEGLLVVAGGDGTVTQVVNGLGRAGFPGSVTLALLPMGTGNDLASTLAVPEDGEGAIETIRENSVRELDIIRVRHEADENRFLINVATGGVGARTTDEADDETKRRWGKMAYLMSALEVARDFEVQEMRLTLDGEERRVRAINVAVGNGRYAGGGWPAAPRANPEDGLIDLVVIEDVGLPEMLALAPGALAGSDYLDRSGVYFDRAKEIRVETEPSEFEFTVDGEVIGRSPVEFIIMPRALKVVVGAEYVPEPEV
ncbi:MAG: diacylglycerol kinase family protein [Rubrobacteraceae bacterium]